MTVCSALTIPILQLAVQSAIGDKMGNAISNLAMALTGFAVAFARGWSMTLVILACVPILAVSGAFIATVSLSRQQPIVGSLKTAKLSSLYQADR